MSDTIKNFIDALTAEAPGAPHSVQLEVDTDGDIQALYEVLLMSMTEILKKWYAPPITISRVSPRDLERLQAYFASFGFKLDLTIVETPRVLHINNRDYLRKSRLEDMKFSVTDAGMLYTVGFSNFPRM
jgi:hypothetical protein